MGLLPIESALSVLANPAPVTVGAMFMVSAGLERCGAIEIMSGYFKKTSLRRIRSISFRHDSVGRVRVSVYQQHAGCRDLYAGVAQFVQRNGRAGFQIADSPILRVYFRRCLHPYGY